MNAQNTVQTVSTKNAQGPERMDIIGIIASPRKEGNTAFIVNKILEGAEGNGAQTQSFRFSNLDIKPCRGCLCCHTGGGGCVIQDDMRKLYGALEHAGTLVLGSPVYMGQMSAQAKIITDRLFAQISPRFSPHFKEKAVKRKLVLSFNQGNPDPGMFQEYFDYTKHMFELLEFDVIMVPVIAGMRNGPAYERQDLPASLMGIGASLVLNRAR